MFTMEEQKVLAQNKRLLFGHYRKLPRQAIEAEIRKYVDPA